MKKGLRFQGGHFPHGTLRHSVSPPEVARLGEVTITAFLLLHECKAKHGNPVWMSFDRLRRSVGGEVNGAPQLPERTLQRALRRLTITDFLSPGRNTQQGKKQLYLRDVLVDVKRVGDKLFFKMPVRARLGLDDLGDWGGERAKMAPPHPVKMAPPPTPKVDEQDGTPLPPKMAPPSPPRWHPSPILEESVDNLAESVDSRHQDGTPAGGQDGTHTKAREAKAREDQLLLTEKIVSAAGAAEIFSSSPPTPPRSVPTLVLVPNPPLKAAQPRPPPAVGQVRAAPIDPSKLDPDDTPGFRPGQPQLWKGKPQVGPMPADFAEMHGKFAHLHWGKLQTAGPVRYGINGMPMRPPSGCITFTTPGPPRVPAKYGEDEAGRELKLKFMLNWYRIACRSRGIEPPRNVGLKGQSRKWFEDALDIFEAQDISPGAWVAWSLDRVLLPMPVHARKRYVPMLKHLFSVKQLVENQWQFRNMEADYTTPHIQTSAEGKLFMRRFDAMDREVCASFDRSEPTIKAIVARNFPEGYAAALKKSQENSMRTEQEVLAQIDRGNWLWPLPSGLRPKKRVG